MPRCPHWGRKFAYYFNNRSDEPPILVERNEQFFTFKKQLQFVNRFFSVRENLTVKNVECRQARKKSKSFFGLKLGNR